ncbi:serpin B6 [Nephila pilipes]|uniref:Serpin B6 n=1 Tax=Nephila pilipes TaxID=299642 RepID=A0A8X6R4B7_NEPPI|nr:serpin B6 [Nephila pilipes]
MKAIDEFRHAKFDDFQAFEIPCNEENISMLFVLPNKQNGLRALEENFKFQNLTNILQKLRNVTLSISLPKFKVELVEELSNKVRALGVESLKKKVTFSGMNSNYNVSMYQLIHKSSIEMHENGAESAGGTY